MKTLALCAMIVAITCIRARADEPKLDCAAIRYYVAVHGKAAALAWAVRNGYGWRDIAEAKRCLLNRPNDTKAETQT